MFCLRILAPDSACGACGEVLTMDMEGPVGDVEMQERSDDDADVPPDLPEREWLSKFEEWLVKPGDAAVPPGFGPWLREKADLSPKS